jgi:hypothetical protein
MLRAHWSALLASRAAVPFVEPGDIIVGKYDPREYS